MKIHFSILKKDICITITVLAYILTIFETKFILHFISQTKIVKREFTRVQFNHPITTREIYRKRSIWQVLMSARTSYYVFARARTTPQTTPEVRQRTLNDNGVWEKKLLEPMETEWLLLFPSSLISSLYWEACFSDSTYKSF